VAHLDLALQLRYVTMCVADFFLKLQQRKFKVCQQLVLGVQQIVVAEAMLLGQALGLNASILASVINNSTGACWASSVNNPVPTALVDKSPPCEREYIGGFSTSLMLKVNCNDFF
jgi:3-hydroxyisobutyrate dehydrogenase-like beta-hydroxyacid dehydrogenase